MEMQVFDFSMNPEEVDQALNDYHQFGVDFVKKHEHSGFIQGLSDDPVERLHAHRQITMMMVVAFRVKQFEITPEVFEAMLESGLHREMQELLEIYDHNLEHMMGLHD